MASLRESVKKPPRRKGTKRRKLGTVRFYAASAVSSSGAGSSTCESQYSTPTIWCGCRQCGQKTFAKSNWLSVARSISMPVETSSPLAGQMKTSGPSPSSMTRPPRQDQNRTGLAMQDGSGAMQQQGRAKKGKPRRDAGADYCEMERLRYWLI